jgi:hypothetical protein
MSNLYIVDSTTYEQTHFFGSEIKALKYAVKLFNKHLKEHRGERDPQWGLAIKLCQPNKYLRFAQILYDDVKIEEIAKRVKKFY